MSGLIVPANIAGRPIYADRLAAAERGDYGPRYIRNAAIIQPDGRLWEAPHHYLIIHAIVLAYPDQAPVRGEQGFVLNDGQFVRRKPALRLAKKNGQFFERFGLGDQLYSEELWIHVGEYPVKCTDAKEAAK